MDISIDGKRWKRRKVVIQAGGSPTSAQPHIAAVQHEIDETYGVNVDVLCTVCKGIFARAKDRHRVISWYYDILGLIDSAAKGCHFGVSILRDICPADVEALKANSAELDIKQSESQPVEKRLKAETLYYEYRGVAFVLRRSGGDFGVLATSTLYFAGGISK